MTVQPYPVLVQDSPTQTWIGGWVEFLQGALSPIFLLVVLAAGILVMIRRGNKRKGISGGVKAAIVFGIGAALVYLILTNTATFADYFRDELPIEQQD